MTHVLAIAAGGAIGALLRYWTSTAVHSRMGEGFPYGTLTVNVTGSLLMGFLYIWLIERLDVGPALRAFLLIGILGAFTTFSTYSLEVLSLGRLQDYRLAAIYVVSSNLLCITAVLAGFALARAFAPAAP